MKIELAYPWTDDKGKSHDPDSKVDVSDEVGTRLIRDGRARPVEATKSAGPSAASAAATKEKSDG